jgi:hypothetical protein
VVYVTINTGSVAIIVNGLTYSGDPTWVTGSTLTGGQVDSAISIQLSATGDAPVTYALQAGSSLPAGLTLTSGGLLSGTVSGISVETTYNFTIEAIDAQAQESPRTFSITITASDQFFEYVTTLLSASNPASTFVSDASPNNFAVSVFGDTRPNNFGPYTPGYYSGYFDGNGDYLTTTFTSAGSSDFCFECWAFISNVSSNRYIFSQSNAVVGSNADIAFAVLVTSASKAAFYWNFNTTQTSVSSTNNVNLNQWNHIAAVRSGSTFTIYVNGTGTSTTSSGTINVLNSTPRNYIGYFTPEGNSTAMIGYMSNLRLVIGSPVYTSNFTPSTSPLTAIANTTLLTCQSNRFIDNSTNNFTITRFGDTLISGFDPFAPLSAYSTYGSGYFDGTTDYLSLSQQTALSFGTGDFTVEAWVYPTANPSSFWSIIDARGSAIAAPWAAGLRLISGNLRIEFYGGTSIQGSINVPLNSWTHVAFARSGTTLRGFVNGVVDINTTMSTNLNIAAGTQVIGAIIDPTYNTGYLTDVRVVKGTAVYTTNFTPPASPLTAVANTSLLTLQNNQPNNNNMFLDSSTNNFLITRNGNTTQGSFSPYGGGWSNFFDGTGDYLTAPANTAFQYGTGNFTIEFWQYYNNLTNFQSIITSGYTPSGVTGGWIVQTGNGDGKINFYYQGVAATLIAAETGTTVVPGIWYHIAIVRNGSTTTIYRNGVSVGSGSDSNSYIANANVVIGGGSNTGFNNYWFNGYLSNVRIVKGTAVYTSNFTPPTTPLTPITNTSLLTCADNRFVDDSANNFTITRNGDVSIQRFNPFNPVLTTPTSYSGYFDGTGDYLTAPNNAATTLNADFTIEFWVYRSASGNNFFFTLGDSFTSTGIEVYIGSTGSALIVYSNGANRISSATVPTVGSWSHVAVVRAGTTVTLYLNGSSLGTWTSSATFSGTSYIGAEFYNGSVTGVCTGYISNVRLVKGTAVYTTAFTPPTAPLTAISGTSLLTLQNATFVDNSTNNFTITAFGNSQPTQFNPFGWTSTTGSSAAYSVTNYGGSMYFDGISDYLNTTVTNSLGSGDFTIECWAYSKGSVGNKGVFHFATELLPGAVSGIAVGFGANASGWYFYYGNGINTTATGAGTPVANTWYHIAVTRSGSTTRLFINGVLATSVSDSFTYTGTQLAIAGYWNTNFLLDGYISDFRIVRGRALYTGAFTPPLAPLTAISNTVLLVSGTSAAIYDSSMITTYETLGNASSTGVIKKYGNSSMSFDGTGDYLTSFNPSFAFGTGNFTIEAWVYSADVSSSTQRGWFQTSDTIGGLKTTYTTGVAIGFGQNSSGSPLTGAVWCAVASSSFIGSSSAVVTVNTWNHIAVVRSSGTTTIYVNGSSVASGSTPGNCTGTNLAVGGYYNTSYLLNGYIDDLRITNGVARYTSNFTPPTTPFMQN